jgi:hypothetical protein
MKIYRLADKKISLADIRFQFLSVAVLLNLMLLLFRWMLVGFLLFYFALSAGPNRICCGAMEWIG